MRLFYTWQTTVLLLLGLAVFNMPACAVLAGCRSGAVADAYETSIVAHGAVHGGITSELEATGGWAPNSTALSGYVRGCAHLLNTAAHQVAANPPVGMDAGDAGALAAGKVHRVDIEIPACG